MNTRTKSILTTFCSCIRVGLGLALAIRVRVPIIRVLQKTHTYYTVLYVVHTYNTILISVPHSIEWGSSASDNSKVEKHYQRIHSTIITGCCQCHCNHQLLLEEPVPECFLAHHPGQSFKYDK